MEMESWCTICRRSATPKDAHGGGEGKKQFPVVAATKKGTIGIVVDFQSACGIMTLNYPSHLVSVFLIWVFVLLSKKIMLGIAECHDHCHSSRRNENPSWRGIFCGVLLTDGRTEIANVRILRWRRNPWCGSLRNKVLFWKFENSDWCEPHVWAKSETWSLQSACLRARFLVVWSKTSWKIDREQGKLSFLFFSSFGTRRFNVTNQSINHHANFNATDTLIVLQQTTFSPFPIPGHITKFSASPF